MSNNRGFTFIEMLLAVAIFALVGLASVAVLDSVTRSDEASRAGTLRLQQLQRAMMLFRSRFPGKLVPGRSVSMVKRRWRKHWQAP